MRPKNDDLNKLLAACNTCAKTWGMDILYDQPTHDKGVKHSPQPQDLDRDKSSAFHISIAWSLEEPSEAQLSMIEEKRCEVLRQCGIDFECVKIKVGNVVTDVPLPKS